MLLIQGGLFPFWLPVWLSQPGNTRKSREEREVKVFIPLALSMWRCHGLTAHSTENNSSCQESMHANILSWFRSFLLLITAQGSTNVIRQASLNLISCHIPCNFSTGVLVFVNIPFAELIPISNL